MKKIGFKDHFFSFQKRTLYFRYFVDRYWAEVIENRSLSTK